MSFTVHALPGSDLERVRAAGVDDFGHPLRPVVVDEEPGTPLRCCLREAHVGEEVALLAWRPLVHAPGSVYAEVGPVFVHAHACPGYADSARYPEGFRARTQVFRSYAADGDMRAAEVAHGGQAENVLARLLADPAAAVVHSRNVAAGCYMLAVTRGPA